MSQGISTAFIQEKSTTNTLTHAEYAIAKQLALGARALHVEQHDDYNQGQVSARAPGCDTHFLIKQVLAGFDETTPADIIKATYDPSGAKHTLAPPELPIHQAIYARRSDVNAIVHTHGMYSVCFGALGIELDAISHDGAWFEDNTNFFDLTSHTIMDMDTGNALAEALGDKDVLFMRNHGTVVVGKTVKEAILKMISLEKACHTQLTLLATHLPYSVANKQDIEKKKQFIFGQMALKGFWDYICRGVNRRFPETKEW